jgi:hypothetical protein
MGTTLEEISPAALLPMRDLMEQQVWASIYLLSSVAMGTTLEETRLAALLPVQGPVD